MAEAEDVVVSEYPTLGWALSCAALCLAVIVYGVAGIKGTGGGIAYQSGYNFAIAVFLAGFLHLAFKRRVSNRIGWLGFFLVYVALMATSSFTLNRQKAEFRQVGAEMKQTLAQVQSSLASGATAAPMPLDQGASTEAGKMGLIIKTMLNRMLLQRQEYERELNAAGWLTVLDGQRLVKDKSMDESRGIILKAKGIKDKYEQKTIDVYNQLRTDIVNSSLDSSSKSSMLRGFDSSVAQGKGKALELWALEGQALDRVDGMLKLLASTRGAWQFEKGQFMFSRKADFERFNTDMAQLKAIGTKQQEMQSASLKKAQEKMQELGR